MKLLRQAFSRYLVDSKILIAAVVYFFSAQLGYLFSFQDTTVLPFWPPSGVAFALIILLGRASWPGIAIGALLVNLMGFWNNLDIARHSIVGLTLIIAAGQVLEALSGYFLLKKWVQDDYPFRSAKNAFQFLFVGILMSALGATISTSGLYFTNVFTSVGFPAAALQWWAANVVGILLFTPLILTGAQKQKFDFSSGKLVEGGIFIALFAGLYFILQSGNINDTFIRALPYLSIPVLLWLAFRFEMLTGITAVFVASIVSIYFTKNGLGPFIQNTSPESILLLQFYIGVISMSTIVLAATVKERQKAQNELKMFNSNLEVMIDERTKALNEEINSRKHTEEKLIHTNVELTKRNTELDNFVYSVSHDLRAPIASVLGLINLASKDDNPDMKSIYLDKINQSAIQQDNFIKEILDQSRNSRLEVSRNEIQFEPLINETFSQLEFATATGSPVKKIIKVKQTDNFFSDRWRLKVILNNIISNSIRYRNGKDPVIKLNITVDNHKALIEIEDNGRGIPTEHLDKVCNMFYRATDDGAGSGLGLYIVKETIEKLKGTIAIESEIGKGTIVKMEIPTLSL